MTNLSLFTAELAALDIAKNVIQIFAIEPNSDGVLSPVNKQVRRADLLKMFANKPKTTIAMEACGGSQYWARELIKLGHEVCLLHPKAVKPYVQGSKNDKNDAIGIYRACVNGCRRVAVKGINERDLSMLHSLRSRAVKQRTNAINTVRSHLLELGIVFGRSTRAYDAAMPEVLEKLEEMVVAGEIHRGVADTLKELHEEVKGLFDKVAALDTRMKEIGRQNKNYERFQTAPGVGPVISAMLCILLSNPDVFKNGRNFAAFIGLAPRSSGSGGKNRVYSIPSKYLCHSYARSLLIQAANSVTRSKYLPPWAEKLLRNKNRKVAVVAIANKLCRQLWAMAKKGEDWIQPLPVPESEKRKSA